MINSSLFDSFGSFWISGLWRGAEASSGAGLLFFMVKVPSVLYFLTMSFAVEGFIPISVAAWLMERPFSRTRLTNYTLCWMKREVPESCIVRIWLRGPCLLKLLRILLYVVSKNIFHLKSAQTFISILFFYFSKPETWALSLCQLYKR